MKAKYRITQISVNKWYLWKQKDREEFVVAEFYDPQLAQKVCDLLNEVSRSQGKF